MLNAKRQTLNAEGKIQSLLADFLSEPSRRCRRKRGTPVRTVAFCLQRSALSVIAGTAYSLQLLAFSFKPVLWEFGPKPFSITKVQVGFFMRHLYHLFYFKAYMQLIHKRS